MASFERPSDRQKIEPLRAQFSRLRQSVHEQMKMETASRLHDNPTPTEEELYMAAFREWLEPQVRDAIPLMYKKGYATQSSGFHGTKTELQLIDGYFDVDEETKQKLADMGVEVLRGIDLGVPKNRWITGLRFRAEHPSIDEMTRRWDAVAAALPYKKLPLGVRPISDRAEEFREQYAPTFPSLEEARQKYNAYFFRT
jgi:hypothetical protein